MKVNYIACDICGHELNNLSVLNSGFRFKFKRKQLDICDRCLRKLHIVADDIQSEEELTNEIFQLKHAEGYRKQDELLDKLLEKHGYSKDYITSYQKAYLTGVSDALRILAPHKIEQCKEVKRLFNDQLPPPPKKPNR